MFEKEFEEYKNLPKWKGKIFMKDEETCFKDGAEFGYQKGIKAKINFTTISDNPIKDDWHKFEKMKSSCLDLIRTSSANLSDDYMAGVYNGMVVLYNSCFLDDPEKEEINYCHRNSSGRWEIEK